MISQTRFARSAVMIASVVLVLAGGLALTPSATASLPRLALVAPLTVAAPDRLSPRARVRYRAFYAQQMASEAALERWSLPLPGAAGAELPEAPRPLAAGVQLK